MILPWQNIDSVFLDMDGTLLDLHFDNHFWLTHVPRRYAEKQGISFEASRDELIARYESVAGTMQWYCVEFWSRELGLDIAMLKEEVGHLIAVHPQVVPFLERMRDGGKRVALVTNAHHKSISLKMRRTALDPHFDAIVCAHDVGVPKEFPEFWDRLQRIEPFDPKRTLLIDDSVPVLRSARDYGMAFVLGVRNPDSSQSEKDFPEFDAVAGFGELLGADVPGRL